MTPTQLAIEALGIAVGELRMIRRVNLEHPQTNCLLPDEIGIMVCEKVLDSLRAQQAQLEVSKRPERKSTSASGGPIQSWIAYAEDLESHCDTQASRIAELEQQLKSEKFHSESLQIEIDKIKEKP